MKRISMFLLIVSLLLTGCAPAAGSAQTDAPQTAAQQVSLNESETKQPVELTTTKLESAKKWDDISGEDHVIFLAGGCFWGMQKYLQTIPGVKRTVVGYANGKWEREYPLTYDAVKTGKTGFRETVYVEYDPDEVSLDTILFAYFYVVDPTVESRQGGDIGPQYQTGIYYTNDEAKEVIDRILAIESERYPKIVVEIEPLDRIVLTLDEYIKFCNNLCRDYDFLKSYADEAIFTENGAKCVLVGAPGQHVIAIVLEGYAYPRYCSWPFADKYELAALLKD